MLETQELINQIGLLSYSGMWILAFLAKFLVVLPEEAVLLVFGYLSGSPNINLYVLMPIVFIGTFLSDILIYSLARRRSKFINKVYDKFFASHLSSRMEWVEANINKIVFFSRFLMQLRILGPILAGRMGMPIKRFLVTNFTASIIYVPFYLVLGHYFRGRIEAIFSGIGVIRNVLITILIIVILVILLRRFRRAFLKYKNNKNNSVI